MTEGEEDRTFPHLQHKHIQPGLFSHFMLPSWPAANECHEGRFNKLRRWWGFIQLLWPPHQVSKHCCLVIKQTWEKVKDRRFYQQSKPGELRQRHKRTGSRSSCCSETINSLRLSRKRTATVHFGSEIHTISTTNAFACSVLPTWHGSHGWQPSKEQNKKTQQS